MTTVKVMKVTLKEVLENNDPNSPFWQYMSKRMEETGIAQEIEHIMGESRKHDKPYDQISESEK